MMGAAMLSVGFTAREFISFSRNKCKKVAGELRRIE